MDHNQLQRMTDDKGFIAALDQSGGSTPKALAAYGVSEDSYDGEGQMFDMVHAMRSRIIMSPAFSGDHILGAILFKETMERQVNGLDTADYLWQKKKIVPFLKIDSGLAEESDGVQLMKPIPELGQLLGRAVSKNIFGTKMRSVIKSYDPESIAKLVEQQFEIAEQVISAGLVPIIEPEVDIHSENKSQIESTLEDLLGKHLDTLAPHHQVMLKLTLPEEDDLYYSLTQHRSVVRVVALSGGYPRDEANSRLCRNRSVIASFSRALASDLRKDQTEDEFNTALNDAVTSIFAASTEKTV